MILCLQSLFKTGHILLFRDEEEVLAQRNWNRENKDFDIVAAISELLREFTLEPSQVRKFFALQGPGPFTAVRAVSVLAMMWKSEQKNLELYPIPTGVFLREKFSEAAHLLLAAGKTAFFSFDVTDPQKFEKLPMEKLSGFEGGYGGFFHESSSLPNTLRLQKEKQDSEIFQNIFRQKELFRADEFLPIYGAEPNIRR